MPLRFPSAATLCAAALSSTAQQAGCEDGTCAYDIAGVGKPPAKGTRGTVTRVIYIGQLRLTVA